MKIRKKLANIAIVGSLIALLTGCVELNQDLKFSPDGKISGEYSISVEESVINLMGASGETEVTPGEVIIFSEDSEISDSKIPEGVKISAKLENGKHVETLTFTDIPLTKIGEALGGDEDSKFELVDDVYIINSDFSSTFSEENAQLNAKVNIKYTFPGEITEHNTGTVEGNTITWTPTASDSVLELKANAQPTNSINLLLIGGISIVILIGIGTIVLIKNRKTKEPVATYN